MEIPPKSLAMPRYSIFAIDGAPGSSGKWIHGATREEAIRKVLQAKTQGWAIRKTGAAFNQKPMSAKHKDAFFDAVKAWGTLNDLEMR